MTNSDNNRPTLTLHFLHVASNPTAFITETSSIAGCHLEKNVGGGGGGGERATEEAVFLPMQGFI